MKNIILNDPIVAKKIGGKYLKMRKSHKLPIYYAGDHFYDRALPKICEKIKEIDSYLSVIDIGANIGDTVSLITDKVQGDFLCVEGDNEYLPLLKENLAKFKKSKVYIEESFCSESNNDSNFKIERIDGTAKLIKTDKKNSSLICKFKTLNNIIKKYSFFKKANVVKIDTDGFEINILKGGEKFIKEAKPVLFFEFTPELYKKNNQNPSFIFEFLERNGYQVALLYDNFGKPIAIIDTSDKEKINELLAIIDNKKIYYYDILTYHYLKKEKYNFLFENELLSCFSLAKDELDSTLTKLKIVTNILDTHKTRLKKIENELATIKSQLNSAKKNLNINNIELNNKKNELKILYSSREWKAALILRRIVKLIIPNKSLRRKVAVHFWRIIKIFWRSARKIKGKLLFYKSFFYRFIKPKKRRKINLESKKIVYIGHPYHNKTKSTEFLIDYLKQFFDVKVILDESWNGKQFPDLSFIDESYLGVIFFQLLSPRNILKKIKNDNLIFFPMYDSANLDYNFWNNLQDLKIINFSRTMHEKLKKWGFDSMYIQYFPNIQEFIPDKKDEVFFWQRLTKININTITKLFKKDDLKIHIHKAIDPCQEFIQPNKDTEDKFQITYSNWFKTQTGLWNIIKQKGIYIAPREYEGIGLSFLEAMAMGKAVIAVNNPTMNEYIENGKTGYLFDLANPQKIDLSNLEQVQKNIYEFMREGRRKWEKDKHQIIDFIKKP